MGKLKIVQNDPWLQPYENAIEGRYEYALYKEQVITQGTQTLSDFASG